MAGGVRTASSTSLAPPSTRSTAISAPSSRCRRRGRAVPGTTMALRYAAEWTSRRPYGARPVRDEGDVAYARRDHNTVSAQRAGRGSHDPAVALALDAFDDDPGADVEQVEGRVEPQVLGDTVAGGPLAKPLGGSHSRAGPRASEPCGGGVGRTGSPTLHRRRPARARRPPRPRASARQRLPARTHRRRSR